ncbi:MAG: CynX/NimT family MFS transporter [Eggerthellaceae bacterium]|jgi:MFS family permease
MSETIVKKEVGELEERGFSSYLPVIVTCAVMCGVPCAMQVSCASIMMPAVADGIGCKVSDMSLNQSFSFICAFLVSPLVGRWFERFDARKLMAAGVLVLAAVFVIQAFATAAWVFWITGFISGLGTTILLGIAPPVLINRWFKKRVGLLMGIVLAFTGIGGVIFIPISQAILDTLGYQACYFIWTAITLVICLPLAVFAIRSYPEDKGLLPYGYAEAQENAQSGTEATATSVRVSDAMRSSIFWVMAIFCLLVNFTVKISFMFPTYVNGLQAAGVAVIITGAILSTLAMAGQAIGKILLGFVSDLSVSKAVVASCVVGILGILGCWFGPTTVLMPLGGFAFGFFYASCLVLAPMVVRSVLGSGRNYPVFWSRLNAVATLGSATGIYFWAFISEQFGGFGADFSVAIVMLAGIAVLGLWLMSKKNALPRATDEEIEAEEQAKLKQAA